VFLLVTPDKAMTWHGDSSTEEERATAAAVVEKLLEGTSVREEVTVAEGEEPEEFWSALGGQGAPLLACCVLGPITERAHAPQVAAATGACCIW
jgi:hypothetical protein